MLKKISFFAIILLVTGAVFIFEDAPLEATLKSPKNDTETHVLSEQGADNKNSLATTNKDKIENIDNDNEKSEEEKETNKCLQKVNELTKEELQLIDGIGEAYSKRIVEAKDIKTVDDLEKINGIGEITAQNIEEFVCQDLEEKLNEIDKELEEDSKNDDKEIKEEDIVELIELIDKYEEKKIKQKETDKEKEKDKATEESVEINNASQKDLEKINGIGPTYSQRIIEKRPFCNLEELSEVKGIGEKTIKDIKDQNIATIEIDCGSESSEDNQKDDEKESNDNNEETEKLKEEVEDLEEEISLLEDDYREVRGLLRDEEKEVETYKKEIKTIQEQRDKCRYPNQININKADIDQLKKLSNVGEAKAKKIYEAKDINTLEDVKDIDGIGKETIKDWIKEGFACTWGDVEEDKDEEENKDKEEENKENKNIEINTAEKDKLTNIHGIGEATANNILDYRKDNCFCNFSDLEEISGIGETTLKEIKEENLATVDPPTECFDKEINITNYPKEITLNEESSIDVKFLDFKESDYKVTLRIMAEDDLIEKTKDINLGEENSESFTFKIEEEIDKKLDLEIKVKNKEETLSKKEIDSFAEVETPESKHLTTFEETNKLENVKIEVFKDEDLIFEDETNEDGLVEEEFEEGSYKLKASRIGYKTKEKEFEVEKKPQIDIELVKKEFIENNNFESWTDEVPDRWELDNQSSKSERSNLHLGPHEYKGPYEEVTTFSDPGSEGKTITYKLKAKVKGTGYIQLGLVRPGYTNASYSDWRLVNSDDWTNVEYEVTKNSRDDFDPDGEFIIRHTSDDDLANKEEDLKEIDIEVDSVSLKVID
ncbi:MAG: helix-hairpin-helix domain-containing protein [Patescibacteria group bacterium]